MLRFKDNVSLMVSLTENIKTIIEKALAKKGNAYLLLSGGSTPLPLYKALATLPLDWKNIHIGLVDERMVSQTDVFSNETLIRDAFCAVEKLNFYSMVLHLDDEEKNIEQVNKNYQLFIGADLILLGMGDDGHTASLFPNDLESTAAILEKYVGIRYTKAPQHPIKRVTCNLSLIKSSSNKFLYFTGTKKLTKYNLAKEEKTPVFHIQQQLTAIYFTENLSA